MLCTHTLCCSKTKLDVQSQVLLLGTHDLSSFPETNHLASMPTTGSLTNIPRLQIPILTQDYPMNKPKSLTEERKDVLHKRCALILIYQMTLYPTLTGRWSQSQTPSKSISHTALVFCFYATFLLSYT